MTKTKVVLVPLAEDDREQFIKDNQWAFKYGSLEEFGLRNIHFYVNKCGFHIVEFYNPFHKGSKCLEEEAHGEEDGESSGTGLGFLFQKVIKK